MEVSLDCDMSSTILGHYITVTLTSDRLLRIIVSGAYLLYYSSLASQSWCVVASWDSRGACPKFWVTLTLTYFYRIIVS